MSRHFTHEELVNRIYGIAGQKISESEPHEGHLEVCAECAASYDRLRGLRAASIPPVGASREFLEAQRRAIYARLGEKPASKMRWAPALAAAFVLVFGLVLYRPAPQAPAVVPETTSDAQFYSEIYSMEQTLEPRAAQPIHALFEHAPVAETDQ